MLTLSRLVSWRYLRRRGLRVALAMASIALGVATFVASQSLNRSASQAMEASSTQLAGKADLQVTNGRIGVDLALRQTIEGSAGVRAAVPLLAEHVTVAAGENKHRALLLGVDIHSEELVRGYGSSLQGRMQIDLRPLLNAGFLLNPGPVVLIGDGLREELALPKAKRDFRILTPNGVRTAWIGGTLDLRETAAAVGGKIILMQLPAALDCVGRTNPARATRIDVVLETGVDRDAVRDALQGALGDRASVHPPKLRDTGLEDAIAGVQVGLTLGATIALFVGVFLVYNSLAVTVAERRHDIGILRALGATRNQVRGLFVVEALILGAAGSGLGILGGLGLARLCLGTVAQVIRQQFSAIELPAVVLATDQIAWALLAGMGVSLLASLVPAAAAAAESPSDALRRVPVQFQPLRSYWPLLAGVLLAVLGVLVFYQRELLGRRAGTYVSAYLIGLAFMLATPFLARLGVRLLYPLAQRFLGIGGRLAADDLARSPSRTGLTIGALALGLAMTIETAGVSMSTEVPLFEWMDRAIHADLFVTSGSAITGGGEHTPLHESLQDELQAAEGRDTGIAEIMPLRLTYVDYGESRVLVYALPTDIYRRRTQLKVTSGVADAWERLSEPGPFLLVSDNFAIQHGVKAEQEVSLPTRKGPVDFHVLATIADYSWNRGTIILDRSRYKEWFDDPLVDSFDLYLKPGADPEQVRRELLKRLGTRYDLVILTRAEFHQHIKSMLDQFYSLVYANGLMALAVSFLGVANTLAISVLHRRREIGLLRSVGATRAQVAGSVAAQALLIGLLGIVLGIGVGVVLQTYVLRVLMVEEAGYFFASLFPLTMTLVASAFVVGAAQVAAVVPASQAAWQSVSDAIAYE